MDKEKIYSLRGKTRLLFNNPPDSHFQTLDCKESTRLNRPNVVKEKKEKVW